MDQTLRFSAHPSEEVLEAYALKRLPTEHIPEIERHLLVCEPCQKALAQLDDFVGAMKSVAQEADPARVRRFPLWQPALAAAVLVLGFFFWRDAGARPVAATIVLSSMRGGETSPPIGPANAPLDLNLASTQMDEREGFRIEVITEAGEPVWSGAVTRSAEGKPVARVDKRLSAGLYWVRLFGPDKQQVQEFGLRLK